MKTSYCWICFECGTEAPCILTTMPDTSAKPTLCPFDNDEDKHIWRRVDDETVAEATKP